MKTFLLSEITEKKAFPSEVKIYYIKFNVSYNYMLFYPCVYIAACSLAIYNTILLLILLLLLLLYNIYYTGSVFLIIKIT